MNSLKGTFLNLRSVKPSDAQYIHSLRTDPRYNAHLSAVTGTVADQRAWIERYKEREEKGAEYYYMIERRSDGARCGVVRLYDIVEDRWRAQASSHPFNCSAHKLAIRR